MEEITQLEIFFALACFISKQRNFIREKYVYLFPALLPSKLILSLYWGWGASVVSYMYYK